MDDFFARNFGLFESLFTFGGVTAFVLWQRHTLNRDIAAREARERKALEKAPADKT
jgi:hypothetical protein